MSSGGMVPIRSTRRAAWMHCSNSAWWPLVPQKKSAAGRFGGASFAQCSVVKRAKKNNMRSINAGSRCTLNTAIPFVAEHDMKMADLQAGPVPAVLCYGISVMTEFMVRSPNRASACSVV